MYNYFGINIQGFSESLQHYTKMLKANCIDHSIYGAQAGLYNCTELWPLIKFHTNEFRPQNDLTQPAVAVWKSPVCLHG